MRATGWMPEPALWVVDPQRDVAQVYRADGSVSLVSSDGSLEGEDVLPDFRVALRDVLA